MERTERDEREGEERREEKEWTREVNEAGGGETSGEIALGPD